MATNYPTSLETRPALPSGVVVPKASDATLAELLPFLHWAMDAIVALEAKVGVTSSAVSTSLDYLNQATRRTRTIRSEAFDLDSASATIDRVIARFPFAVTITAARIVYEDATTVNGGGGVRQARDHRQRWRDRGGDVVREHEGRGDDDGDHAGLRGGGGERADHRAPHIRSSDAGGIRPRRDRLHDRLMFGKINGANVVRPARRQSDAR